jgi:hypothetical protein
MRFLPETGRNQVITVVAAVALLLVVAVVSGYRSGDESNAQLQHQLLFDNGFLKSVTCTTDHRSSTARPDTRICLGHWSGGFCADASGDYYDRLTITVSGDAYKIRRDHFTSQGTCDAPTT